MIKFADLLVTEAGDEVISQLGILKAAWLCKYNLETSVIFIFFFNETKSVQLSLSDYKIKYDE